MEEEGGAADAFGDFAAGDGFEQQDALFDDEGGLGGEEVDLGGDASGEGESGLGGGGGAGGGGVGVGSSAEAAASGGTRADQRITTKFMTKYEKARILGTRALQLR
jgi:DNA-directed RNA polymerase I, II, and III subunit RPABC2